MNIYDLAFYVLAFITILSAVIVVFNRNLVYSAYSLLFTLLSISGLYVLLLADFIAIVQIVVYVGGILILLLFGIMLTQEQVKVPVKANVVYIALSMLSIGLIAAFLYKYLFTAGNINLPNLSGQQGTFISGKSTIKYIGNELLTNYVLYFELLGMVLLIALIGATTIARKENNR
ncbi:MAG TPA: NADH-quinone oxidoreductase subunit J [Ignavibacteriales bacterium]|nr:NADH-quinone oxidoreductase subunit J [Ignavibacteriales bacterium]